MAKQLIYAPNGQSECPHCGNSLTDEEINEEECYMCGGEIKE